MALFSYPADTFMTNISQKIIFWHRIGIDNYTTVNQPKMEVAKKDTNPEGEKEWEDPLHPTEPSDARDKEQIERQYKEAKRRKDNLTETDHIDKEKKN
jgi:hypothetical protein